MPFHGGRGGVSVALGQDTWVPLAVAGMSKGQMQQSWPEKGMVTRCSDSLSDVCVLPPGGSLRPAQVVCDKEGNQEPRKVEEGGGENQSFPPDSST